MAELVFPRPNVIQRAELLERCEVDLDYRNAVYTLCAKDKVFWINNFGYTFDPRSALNKHLPFVLFPKQEDYIKWRIKIREDGDHGVCEKSRDMGVSWLNVADHVHCWLFEDGFKGTFGSRKKEYVDELNNIDSLLEKVRYMIRRLPTWMMPSEFRLNYLKIFNLDTGALITGEIGSDTGRGGRSSIYDADEFAFLADAQKADSGISQNTVSAFYTSTPNGNDNLYFKKRFSGKIPVFTFHYYDHPAKDEAWLADQRRKLDELVVAREILIDYEGSSEGVVIKANHVRAAVNLALPGGGRHISALDVAAEGGNNNVYLYRHGNIVKCVEAWKEGTTWQTAQRVCMNNDRDGVEIFFFDENGVGAGVAGDMGAMVDDGRLDYEVIGLKNQWPATEIEYDKFRNRPGREIFANLRAELYWMLRIRFERTYEYVNNIAYHDPRTLISIPDDPDLIQNISKPTFSFNSKGLIQIEDKKKMLTSPDWVDTLTMLFAPMELAQTNCWWMK